MALRQLVSRFCAENVLPNVAALTLACASLCGCATSPGSIERAASVPPDRVFEPNYFVADHGPTKLIVVRDSGLYGIACSYEVAVDGTHVADIHAGEKIETYVQPGQHFLRVTLPGLCGGDQIDANGTTEGSAPLIFRISIAGNSGTTRVSQIGQ